MVSVDWVPLCFAGCDALDIRRVFPIPGLTGLPSLLIVLAIVEGFNQLVMLLVALKGAGRGKPRHGS
jgi:hypothetical protein